MANQNLSQILPYKFRNTGGKAGTLPNLLLAPPLELVSLNIPIPVPMSAIISRDSAEPETIQTDTGSCWDNVVLKQLLTGKSSEHLLWNIGIWAGHLELDFRDQRDPTIHSVTKFVSAKIKIETSAPIECRAVAYPYGKEPERHLVCRYGDDAAWGKFVSISEATAQAGVQSAIFYPEAKIHQLERIAHA